MNITVRQIEFRSTNGTDTIFGWIYIPNAPLAETNGLKHEKIFK